MTKLNIHWLCPEPTHYHSHFFNVLSQDPEVSLVVHFLNERFADHPWTKKPSMLFEHRTLDARWGLDSHLFRLALDGSNKFVVSGWNSAFLVLFIMLLAVLRRDFLFWSDTPNLSRKRRITKRILRSSLTNMIFRTAEKVLVTGRPGVEAFTAMGCPVNKLVSFPFFVPLPSLSDRLAQRPLTIVSLGRLDNSLKGLDIGLQALSIVRHKLGLNSFQYLIGGTGPDSERLKKQAQVLGIAECVQFLGWLEVEEVTQLLGRTHVLLHPARWDPFPVTVIEAMASGVVVMGSEASGSVCDRIVNGENGFTHPVGDVNNIVNQLAILLSDSDRLRRMGIAARRTAEEWPSSRGVEIIKSAFLN